MQVLYQWILCKGPRIAEENSPQETSAQRICVDFQRDQTFEMVSIPGLEFQPVRDLS
jgi:hypothetical protein